MERVPTNPDEMAQGEAAGPEHAEGGESTCYAQYLTPEGDLLVPSDRIKLLEKEQKPADGELVLSIGPGGREDLAALAPRPGEPAEAYRARLEQPAERAAAWRIVLTAEQRPLSISLESGEPDLGRFLLAYVHELAG